MMAPPIHLGVWSMLWLPFDLLLCALRCVAGGDGKLGCLCGKAGTNHLCNGSAHSSGCVVNGYCVLFGFSVCVCVPHFVTHNVRQ